MDESSRLPQTPVEVAGVPGLPPPIARLTLVQWLVSGVAGLGFAFDLYETLVMPLIARPALTALGHFKPGSPGSNLWVGLMFYLPLASGGVFGLLGGYLTDLLGRRRVLLWSILLYAFSACAAGLATSLPQLLFFRCTTIIGVCVEYVAGVAWVRNFFPIPNSASPSWVTHRPPSAWEGSWSRGPIM